MNYRHAYHAGNFADVVKHVALSRIVEYLKQKDKAFRVVDTHAGIGLYDLSSEEAQKTGEWREGIGRLIGASIPREAAVLLAPYLDAVRDANPPGKLTRYPGSPAIARHLLRRQDRLSAVELHPEDAGRLARHFAGDFQTRVIELDGWLALGAHLPPKEKRGLVLVDPPFEKDGEFGRLLERLLGAHHRWPGGIYALWYPIKDRRAVDDFRSGLAASGIAKILDLRFEIRRPSPEPRLDGTGLIVVNPPFTFESEMQVVLPVLHRLLAEIPAARWSVDWLTGERTGGGPTGA
ncbi:23S rRNA (adenine(2030)-N(6))-methyltransferase RlmJ [Rhizobiaceae sp. 2RAB30]